MVDGSNTVYIKKPVCQWFPTPTTNRRDQNKEMVSMLVAMDLWSMLGNLCLRVIAVIYGRGCYAMHDGAL
jgi:hypothetical protein